MLMGERRVRHGLGRLVSMLVLGLSIGTAMPVHAQSNLRRLWLVPTSLVGASALWSLSSNVWVKCARSGMITDGVVKLLIDPDLGSECHDIIQKAHEFMVCLSGADLYGTSIMSPREWCYGSFEQLKFPLPQPEVSRGNWFWRLEKPDDVYGSINFRMDSARGLDLHLNLENARDEVQEILKWLGDIWHIDRDVDGRAARIVQSLRNNFGALGVHNCPVEEGGTWYTVGEDGISVRTSPTVVDEQYVRIYQDASNEGYERRVCVRFVSESVAVRAVEHLAKNVEEGLRSDADLWEEVDRRIRERIWEDDQNGVPLPENEGIWSDISHRSTMYQRPYRTLTLQSTGETIQLWIGQGAFVKVRWINMPAES